VRDNETLNKPLNIMSITNEMLNQMSMSELRSLNEKVVELIRWRRKMETIDVKNELSIGMTVTVNHPKAKGKVFLVHKINRTKAVLKEGNRQWNVPLNLINLN